MNEILIPISSKEFKEKVNELDDDATLNDVLEILGMNMNREEMMPKEFK